MTTHIRTAFRYLNRNRMATFINVIGLSVALSAAFLMLQYLDYELSYDTSLQEHKNIYRIATNIGERKTTETFYNTAELLKESFPEVKATTRFYRWPANTGVVVEYDGKIYNEKNYMFADKEFFEVFSSMLIAGSVDECLSEPNSIVLSDRLAIKMFGTTDVIGKTVSNPERRNKPEKITGVFKHTPANSHFDIDLIRPYEWIPDEKDMWTVTVWTYVRLNYGSDVAKLESKLNTALQPNIKEPATVWLQPLASIHLDSNLESEIKSPGNRMYVLMVGVALGLITLIALINYVNLETARFIKRLKEVGIRRIIGSSKASLLGKLFTEFSIMMIITVIVSAAITISVFPYFGYVTGLSLTTPHFNVPELWIGAVVTFLVVTILAGTYPFLSLIKVNIIASLKGKLTENFQGVLVRRSLLTFQLVASLTLMGLVMMATFQLDYMRRAKMNFDTKNILTVYNSTNYTYMEDSLRAEKNEVFRNRLMNIPSVVSLTTSSAIPGEPIGFTYTDLAKRSMSDPDRQVHYKVMYIDYDFIPSFGLKLLAGRNYSQDHPDANCLVVTESTIKELGFASVEEALNQKIYFIEDEWEQWTIIGIVQDYRHESVKTAANPGIFRIHRNKGQMVYYSIKLSDNANTLSIVPTVEKLWNETWPGKPFDYFFLDQHYDQQYKSEVHFSRVFTTFSCVAIFIACLGIMGMTLFEANARIKEVGIRKVLGAGVINIITLLTKDSFRTLLLAFLMALPLVYFLSSQWLVAYPDRIDFSAWFMVVPLSIMIALISIVSLSQVIRASTRNPVESLRQE